jgi:hypothetical protein
VPALSYELKKILKGSALREEQLEDYQRIKMLMGKAGASERTARLMVNYLKQDSSIK